jgi:hypothetical protein
MPSNSLSKAMPMLRNRGTDSVSMAAESANRLLTPPSMLVTLLHSQPEGAQQGSGLGVTQ